MTLAALRWWRPWRRVVLRLCGVAGFFKWRKAEDWLLEYLFPGPESGIEYTISFDPATPEDR